MHHLQSADAAADSGHVGQPTHVFLRRGLDHHPFLCFCVHHCFGPLNLGSLAGVSASEQHFFRPSWGGEVAWTSRTRLR